MNHGNDPAPFSAVEHDKCQQKGMEEPADENRQEQCRNEEDKEKNEGNDGSEDHDDDDDDEDDDDFGDFEQAPQSASELGTSEEQQSSSAHFEDPCSSKTLRLFEEQDRIYGMSITALFEEAMSSYRSSTANFCRTHPTADQTQNLFPLLNSDTDGAGLQGLILKAFQFWIRIYSLEEMEALQYRWDNSRSYQLFLSALTMNAGIGHLTKGKESSKPGIGEQQHSLSSKGPKDVANAKVDSLMVPPADFDWRTSGLANPLNASFKSAQQPLPAPPPPPFDCSAFMDDYQKQHQIVNSTSILERDLQAFGLISPNNS